jgi:hypothetical protein
MLGLMGPPKVMPRLGQPYAIAVRAIPVQFGTKKLLVCNILQYSDR